MDNRVLEVRQKKCFFIPTEKGKYNLLKDPIKKMQGFYNGAGWYVAHDYKNQVLELCETADIRYLELPLMAESFDKFRKEHTSTYYQERVAKLQLKSWNLKCELNLQNLDISQDEIVKALERTSKGKELLETVRELDLVEERVKQAEQEEKIAKLDLDPQNKFKYLLDPIYEDQISKEIKSVSPGIGVGFKIKDIDLKLPGGAISIVAGPTSHGKTSIAINFCLGALEQEETKSIYFFSYEESRASIVSLFLNAYIGESISANNRSSIKNYFREEHVKYIAEPYRKIFLDKKNEFFERFMNTGRLNINYSDMNILELIAAIRYIKKHTNVGLICIDYMQLLSYGTGGRYGSRQEELKHICLLLKDCAVETGLPILLAAQFNRSVIAEADLSPTNIGEAGDIERVANLILGFWNRNFVGFSREGNRSKEGKTVQRENTIYMEILKGRETGAGQSEIFDFNGNSGKLSNQTSLKKQEPIKNIF